MPWSRMVGAKAGKLRCRVRVCIEGIPSHAWQIPVVKPLSKASTHVEEIDSVKEKPEEESCFCLWIWTSDPDAVPKTAILQLEEPITTDADNYPRFDSWDPPVRAGALETPDYKVIVHLDRIIDYTSPPSSSSHRSFDNDVSGRPDEELDVEWPRRFRFDWQLGVPDGQSLHHTSALERLGGRRDRSPPRGGGGGGNRGFGGFSQIPPPSRHDLQRDGRSHFGGSGGGAGSGYRTRKQDQGSNNGEGSLVGGNQTPAGEEIQDREKKEERNEKCSSGQASMELQWEPVMQGVSGDTLISELAARHTDREFPLRMVLPDLSEFEQMGPCLKTCSQSALISNLCGVEQELFPEVGDPQAIVDPQAAVVNPAWVSEGTADLYTKKVNKAVLATPTAISGRKNSKNKKDKMMDDPLETPRRSNRLANKPTSDLTMEEQATALLMKKCGTLGKDEQLVPEKGEQFRVKFAGPLDDEVVDNLRDTFGLPKVGGAECLAAIAVNAEA